jgi:hypothetical protein
MTARDLVLDELSRSELRVPELCAALRQRKDLTRWQRVRLFLFWNGTLYVDLRRWEDQGLVESVRFQSQYGHVLTRWRKR